MMKQMVCVWFPNWSLQRLRFERPELKQGPVVVFTNAGGRGARVVTTSRRPAEQGVRPGQPLAEAELLCDELRVESRESRVNSVPSSLPTPHSSLPTHFIPHEPAADITSLRTLAQSCDQFAPYVGPEDGPAPECLLLDATGCTSLFGDDQQYVHEVVNYFRGRGLSVRVALAPTIGAAWGAARCVARPQQPIVVRPEHLDALLDSLPVAALRLPDVTVATLHELGLHGIGQLRRLPRASLPSRFGGEVLLRLDQAFGNVPELLTTERPEPPCEAVWAGEEPLADRWMLATICRQLVEQLVARLAPRREGIQRLLCRLAGSTGARLELVVNLVSPCDVIAHLVELLRLQQERAALPEDICHVALQAAETGSMSLRQRDLFGDEVDADRGRELSELIDRLSSRLGPAAVLRPHLVPDAQPEHSVACEPWLSAEGQRDTEWGRRGDAETRRRGDLPFLSASPRRRVSASPIPSLVTSGSSRPLRLLTPPEGVAVSLAEPEGTPVRFRWQQREHRVTRSWGPERIETGWWRSAAVRRDYFRVEVHTGHWFWLFHRLEERDWFLHGAFD